MFIGFLLCFPMAVQAQIPDPIKDDVENKASALKSELLVGDAYVRANPDQTRWTIGAKAVAMTFALEGGKFQLVQCQNKLTSPARDYANSRPATDMLSSGNPLFPNNTGIEPVWHETLHPAIAADPAKKNVRLPVKQGDLIGFAVSKRDGNAIEWITKVSYEDGASYTSSDDTKLDQGPIWHYYLRVSNTGYMEKLTALEGEGKNKVRVAVNGSIYYPMWTKSPAVNGTTLNATDYDAVRVWQAPKDGTVSIGGPAKLQGSGTVEAEILRIKDKPADSPPARRAEMGWRSEGASAREVIVGGRSAVQLDWALASLSDEGFQAQFHIQAYPGASILRYWVELKNAGAKPIKPSFFPQIYSLGLRADDAESFTHYWMVGGNNRDDQGMLKSAEVKQSYHQVVDSHGQWTYAPWMALARKSGDKDGWFTALDSAGNWAMSVDRESSGPLTFTASLPEFQFSKGIQPGEKITLPMMTFGVFHRNLDDMGRRIYDWQYTYLWDYTRHDWYTQMLYAVPIYGMNTGTRCNQENFTRRMWQDLYYGDLARRVGFDIVWDDAGWFAQAGWWNTNREGPDFAETVRYTAKSGMKWTLWFLGKPSAGMMDAKVGSWGNFQWRTDGVGLYSLEEDQTFRGTVTSFLDKHPRASFHTCAGGGTYAHTFEYQRLAAANQFSDFGGDQTNYYLSYIDTPDKWYDINLCMNSPDYATKGRRMLSMVPIWYVGEINGEDGDLTPIADSYRYLLQSGVAGKWSYTMHPPIKGGVEHQYCQRLSYDGKRSIVILKHQPEGEVTIYPRGLLPSEEYLIEFEKSQLQQTLTGSDLMEKGITIKDAKPGELVYLNLPHRPRSGRDKTPPAAPGSALLRRETNLGTTGVGIHWSPGTDENWVSGYEVRRGDRMLGKIGKGTYAFDHADGWDPKAEYTVRTVDGDGNVSGWTRAKAMADGSLTFSAFSGHSAQSGRNGWRAEMTTNSQVFTQMTWVPPAKLTPVWADLAKDPGGVEGYWEGGGTARVGHGWQQASTNTACVRTWIAPQAGKIGVMGRAMKDLYHQNKGGQLRVRILRNETQVWPGNGWANVPQGSIQGAAEQKPQAAAGDSIRVPTLAAEDKSGGAKPQGGAQGAPHDLTLKVAAGDAVRFVLDRGTTPENDYIAWMPKIVYEESGGKLGESSVVRIRCGSDGGYTDQCGIEWAGDRFFAGGRPVASKAKIEGASPTLKDEALYQSGRAGKDFTYSIPVNPGLYCLRLKFAETKYKLLFERPMNLSINGRQELRNFDIGQAASGSGKAYEKVFRYLVPDASGKLVLRFTGGWEPMQKTDEAMVQAIEILPEDKPAIRIDCGSDAEFIDWSSSVWSRDADFKGGQALVSNAVPSQASPTLYDQGLYQTARTGKSFSYTLSVPQGLYTVHLKFAELWLKEIGKRPMNIEVNGRRARESWDPAQAAGETGMAADFRVEDVTPDKDGNIKIAVSAAGANEAILQGIEIE